MAKFKSKVDNGSPCFTPLVIGIFGLSPLTRVKCVLASVYSSTTAPLKWLSTPNLFRPALISLWETASNAFARSRNTTLSLFLLRLACFCIRCNRNPFSEQAGASMKPQCRGLSGTPLVTL